VVSTSFVRYIWYTNGFRNASGINRRFAESLKNFSATMSYMDEQNQQNPYGKMKDRLDEILAQVRAKDVPLEQSLDLYEEALKVGNRCVEMLDDTVFSAEEMEAAGMLDGDPKETTDASAGLDGAQTDDMGTTSENNSQDESDTRGLEQQEPVEN
jgi:exodeoxyribonuclease VII small subunit